MKTTHRATFGGRLSAVLVTAGSAVGLGNIWRFPYVAGENGGGAFLLIYILSVLLLGVPIMLSEFAIGRNTHRNAVGAYTPFRAAGRSWATTVFWLRCSSWASIWWSRAGRWNT